MHLYFTLFSSPPFEHEVLGLLPFSCVVPGLFNLINTSFVDELSRAVVICF